MDELRFGGFTIEKWMKVVPRGYLDGTTFGHAPEHDVPPEIREQSMLRQVQLMDLALFLAAERTSARVAAALASHAPDDASLVFLATQALDEARHFEAFARRFDELGIARADRDRLVDDLLSPAYRGFLDILLEAADRGDYEAGVVGLNVILEGMAFPLYDYEMRYWAPFDPGLVDVIRGAFRDECRHVGFGERAIAHRLARDPAARARVQRVATDLGRKMRDVFRDFLAAFVGFYDLAVQEHPERCRDVEIVPGRRLIDTPADEQVRWLESRIEQVHRERLARLGLEAA